LSSGSIARSPLEEQAIHSPIFQNLNEVHAAEAKFVERYNCQWRLEKLGCQTPRDAGVNYNLHRSA
jgi:hypothetical protein